MIVQDSFTALQDSFSLGGSGYMSTLPLEEPDFIQQALEKSIEEITGKPCHVAVEKIKIGFY